MKDYTTQQRQRSEQEISWDHPLIGEEWDQVVDLVLVDLEETAREENALQRRREVRSAKDLLRLVLAYALCDWSLRLVAAWATIKGLCCISDVALRKRLRAARKWLGRLVTTCLLPNQMALALPDVQLRIVDATSISRPGSSGTDWRVHLSFNLGQLRLDAVEVTDVHGGESLARFSLQPGEIILGDRGYARRPALGLALEAEHQLVIRIGWRTLPLQDDEEGTSLDLLAWLRKIPASGPLQRSVWVETPRGTCALRLIACRLPQQAVEQARRRIRRQASRKGRTPRKGTLEAAAFFMVVTNLPEGTWKAEQVLELYRIRWQVEIAIKRLKSIWHLDHLRAKDVDLAQTYLLGKLLGALVGDALTGKVRDCLPAWFGDLFRPVSLWRLHCFWFEWIHRAVVGRISLDAILKALPRLQRYLRDPLRKKRRQQLAYALDWIQKLSSAADQRASLTIPASMEYEMVQS